MKTTVMIAAVPCLMTIADAFIILEPEMTSHHGVDVTAVAAHDR